MKPLFEKDAAVPKEKRIVFIGDSITDDGTFIAYLDAYFLRYMPDRDITLINLGISSETASGLSEPDHPFPRPCIHERLGRALAESRPDWVVIGYGMNDAIYHPYGEERFQAYRDGMLRVIADVHAAGAKAIVVTPPPFDPPSMKGTTFLPSGRDRYSYLTPYEDYDAVLQTYADWLVTLEGVADGIVNTREPLRRDIDGKRAADPGYVSGDGIHPHAAGHWVIARTLLRELFNLSLERVPDEVAHPEGSAFYGKVLERRRLLNAAWREHVGHSNPNKADALPLETALAAGEELLRDIRRLAAEPGFRENERSSVWKGHERRDFYVEGREGLLILPKTAAKGRPWVWRAEFFDAFAWADMAMLERGWAIAYYRISDLYGCDGAVRLMRGFQDHAADRYGLAAQAALFGFSRGGLYAFNYAAAHPERVAALYLDAPVLDLLGWPAGRGAAPGQAREWADCLAVYGETEETFAAGGHSPLDHAEQAAAAGIPILIVAGDADIPVPIEEHAYKLEARMRELGHPVELIVKPGVGHHPHSLEDPAPIVRFLERHASAAD